MHVSFLLVCKYWFQYLLFRLSDQCTIASLSDSKVRGQTFDPLVTGYYDDKQIPYGQLFMIWYDLNRTLQNYHNMLNKCFFAYCSIKNVSKTNIYPKSDVKYFACICIYKVL